MPRKPLAALAASVSALDDTLTVRAKTVYDATTNLGVVKGRFRVENAGRHTDGSFLAVDTNGSLDGFVGGAAKHDQGKLLGGFSATFDPATGFTGGQLGTGTSDNAAVFVSGRCGGEDDGSGDSQNHHKHGKHGRNGKR